MPTACSRCSRRVQAQAVTEDPAQAAARPLTRSTETAAEEEPMRRYPHPIPTDRVAGSAAENTAAMEELLQRLACQNQLLVDLVEAVNALTAALPNPCPQG